MVVFIEHSKKVLTLAVPCRYDALIPILLKSADLTMVFFLKQVPDNEKCPYSQGQAETVSVRGSMCERQRVCHRQLQTERTIDGARVCMHQAESKYTLHINFICVTLPTH